MPTHGAKKVAGLRSIQLHGLVLVCALAFSGLSMAQGLEPETSDVRLAPALIDPAISSQELAFRRVPLTKHELEPLARAWLEIVRTETQEIVERQDT
jgi:small conductance mechanosensitive channel